jgi:hypothetical protein
MGNVSSNVVFDNVKIISSMGRNKLKNIVLIGEDYKNTNNDYLDLLKTPELFANYKIWAENCNKYKHENRSYMSGVHSEKILKHPGVIYLDCIRYHPVFTSYIYFIRLLIHTTYIMTKVKKEIEIYSDEISKTDSIKDSITTLCKRNNMSEYRLYDSILSIIPLFNLCILDATNVDENFREITHALHNFKLVYDELNNEKADISELLKDIYVLINDVHKVCEERNISSTHLCEINADIYSLYINGVKMFLEETFGSSESSIISIVYQKINDHNLHYQKILPVSFNSWQLEPSFFVDLQVFVNYGLPSDIDNIIILCGSPHFYSIQSMLNLFGLQVDNKPLTISTNISGSNLLNYLKQATFSAPHISGGGISPTWISLLVILAFIILLIGYLVITYNKSITEINNCEI